MVVYGVKISALSVHCLDWGHDFAWLLIIKNVNIRLNISGPYTTDLEGEMAKIWCEVNDEFCGWGQNEYCMAFSLFSSSCKYFNVKIVNQRRCPACIEKFGR